jgi:hypothetical protein
VTPGHGSCGQEEEGRPKEAEHGRDLEQNVYPDQAEGLVIRCVRGDRDPGSNLRAVTSEC